VRSPHHHIAVGIPLASHPPGTTMPATTAARSGQDPGTFRCALASASANGFQPLAECASLRMRSIM